MTSRLILIALLFCIAFSTTAQVITKETDVPKYKLPALLKSQDGKTITNAADWENIRRPEILQLLEKELFGIAPTVTINLPSEVTNSRDKYLNGKAKMMETTINLTYNGKILPLDILLFLPNKVKQNIPIIIGLNEHGNHTAYPEWTFSMPKGWVPNEELLGVTNHKANKVSRGALAAQWPILNMIDRGYGVALVYCGDIDPDFDDGFANGAHAFLLNERTDQSWGTIAAWAWGIRQVVEYFRYLPEVNQQNIIVAGQGVQATAALWAAALDNRIGLVIAQNAGTGGAALSKRKFGATIQSTTQQHPHWFAKRFQQYAGKEKQLPFDQHFLLSLIAPRPIYLANTFTATSADPKGAFEAATKASPAYLLYDRLGLEQKEFPVNNAINHGGYIAYHIRQGTPAFTIYDWERFLDYADLLYK